MENLENANGRLHVNGKKVAGVVLSALAVAALEALRKVLSQPSTYQKTKDSIEIASEDELRAMYEIERLDFCKTGIRSYKMNMINDKLSEIAAKKWENDPHRSRDPYYRWTDANRWDKD